MLIIYLILSLVSGQFEPVKGNYSCSFELHQFDDQIVKIEVCKLD